MSLDLLTEKNGRIACFMLFVVDVLLGVAAIFLPYFYAGVLHPELSNPPIDFIVRTGVLWFVFAIFQGIATISKQPEKWFFLVGLIRLMEIPADIMYGILAIGSPLSSRLMILGAPIFNAIFGIFLTKLYLKLEKENKN